VIFKPTTKRRTLYHLQFNRLYKAGNGTGGQGRNRTGRGGEDLFIELPPGTLVTDADSNTVLKDLVDPDEVFVVAHGGRGGLGNARFKSATNRTPRFAQPGEPGQILNLRLELKLLADVGIVGLPNAGKSTLIAAISAARPKVADYPFTTLTPTLGVVATKRREPFAMADIPGLIEGAHAGTGLGIRFLRHVERTRLLLHLVDVAAIDPDDPLKPLETVNRELKQYSRALAEKP
jgi:GTP-binding protein